MTKASFVSAWVAGVVVLDQLTKLVVREYLPLHAEIEIIPGFAELTHVKNTGGAFGLLARAHDSWRLPFFVGVGLIAIAALLHLVRTLPEHDRWGLFAVAAVLGGAVGNLIDRIVFGEVTDFVSLHWREYYWPAFNVADSFITIGAVVLVLHSLFHRDGAGQAA
jgi:signal peptidase II